MLETLYEEPFNDPFKSITADNEAEFLDQKEIENSCLRKDIKEHFVIMNILTSHVMGTVMKMLIYLLDVLSLK